jgi:ATP-dependent helicase HrpA
MRRRCRGGGGGAVATEKVSLYGLVLIPARTVRFAPINPKLAREIFIHHALVLSEVSGGGDGRAVAPFMKHNQALVAEVEGMEAKIRQKNLLAGIETRYAFYDARVPVDVVDGVTFERWRIGAEKGEPRLLFMNKEDLLRADAPAITPENYPDRLADAGGGLQLPVTYRYEPGDVMDGVMLTVPMAALAQLRGDRYEWLVPGMLEEKIAALLRGLPGALRRNFVPVPEWARGAATALGEKHHGESEESLRDALAAYLGRQTGVEIKGTDFAEKELPEHLRMNFRVMDDTGRPLALSRDLPTLQRKFASQAAHSFAGVGGTDRRFQRDGIVQWDFGDLPESLVVQRFNMRIVAYPTLVDLGETCGLRLMPSKEDAEAAHRGGVRRLFRLEYRKDLKSLRNQIPEWTRMALQYWLIGPTEELKEDLVTLMVDRALFEGESVAGEPRTAAEWDRVKHKGATRLFETGEKVAGLVGEILEQNHALALAMESAPSSATTADLHDQLVYLLPKHFVLSTPTEWIEHVPRYLAGMRLRLEKLRSGGSGIVDRDLEGMGKVAGFWNTYLARKAEHEAIGLRDLELELFRWMLEEYRVSLFSQELGVAVPVSERRLEKQWEKVRKA